MIGIIRLGIGASVIEASPRHNLPPIQQQDNRHDQDRHRHERERIENERHEENLRRIAHGILKIIFDK